MTNDELFEKLKEIQQLKCETQNLEIKRAKKGCPKRLYDTLSSFSNQDEGGVIIFGIDEDDHFNATGVYDPQDLQKQINNQCLQMKPIVRPLITAIEDQGKHFVSAEIPGIDLADRPCYYRGIGRIKGSYIRIGDSDEHMTEYEIYSYEAFRKKYQDDIREVDRANLDVLDSQLFGSYIAHLKEDKPKLAQLPDSEIYRLMSIIRDGKVTLSTVLLFCPYPQAYFPQLCVTAIVVPGTEIGDLGDLGERFLDNVRIEGTIPEILEQSLRFVRKNMKTRTIIHPETGTREDITDYPIPAIREAVLNALVHRDYSFHTEGMPIQLILFSDRLEIRNPGGIYGRISVDQLGQVQADTRNPVLALALEVLGITENRYSGIPTIRKSLAAYNLPAPVFQDRRGQFIVQFYKNRIEEKPAIPDTISRHSLDLIEFCRTPRSRKEVCQFLGLTSPSYAIKTYIMPLVEANILRLSMPDKPKSSKQRYFTPEDF